MEAYANLSNAFDKMDGMQIGENGNPEHKWTKSGGLGGLAQLYFQLTRAESPDATSAMREKYRELLTHAFAGFKTRSEEDTAETGWIQTNRQAARNLFCLIGNIRDIDAGKGERQLAYAFIWEMYAFSPALAQYAIYSFVHGLAPNGEKSPSGLQYGGWSDIKYFCNAIAFYAGSQNHPLITYALTLMGDQLLEDKAAKAIKADASISLAARWLPKENIKTKKAADGTVTRKVGRYAWQYGALAKIMFPYERTARSEASIAAAQRKARTDLHKLYAPLNKALGTVQIAMSAGSKEEGIWDQISFGRTNGETDGDYHVTGATLRRHPKAWKNITNAGETRSHNPDRIVCAEKYVAHMEKTKTGQAQTRGKTLNTYELVRDAVRYHDDATERARINSQWIANSENAPSTGMMIPAIDVSSSMTCDESRPLYSAIGTGLRISENAHPALRNRAITFASDPSWFNFSTCVDFSSRVQAIKNDRNWGGSTDLVKTAEMVVTALKSANVPPEEAAEVVIVVLSDMQIDCGWNGSNWGDTAFKRMSRVCKDAGYEPFHFVWWNLRTTSGFPAPTHERNTTMVSGYNAALLKAFEGKGIEALRDYTPERMIQDILTSDRLKPLGALFDMTYPEM